jgi:hypothetical protein
MIDKKAEPIEFIMSSQLGGVLSKAFAELYRTKPNFPVMFLGNWLKEYCRSERQRRDKQ